MAEELVNVTDGAFERAVLQADRPVVAVLWSREDPRAGQVRQVMEAAGRRYAGLVRIAGLEAKDAPQVHSRYAEGPLPQFLFFRDGRLIARVRGLPREEMLHPWVEYLLGRGPAPGPRPPSPERPASSGRPVAVTDTDFDRVVLGATKPVLVDFWAAWCGPCRALAPVIERLAAEFAGRAVVAKLEVDANPRTAQRYGVMSIPTLIFFKDGEEMSRLVGVQPEELLRSRLAALL